MSRSLKKEPFVDAKLMARINEMNKNGLNSSSIHMQFITDSLYE